MSSRVALAERRPEPPAAAGHERAPSCDFDSIYEEWFDEVSRWIRAMGGPEADREDLVQDVFMVVHRRLADFDGQNVAGWLYKIARRKVRDFRRLLWVRHLLFGSVPLSDNLTKAGASPAESLETKEKRETLELLLAKLNESERAAIVLFEVEGYSGEEIAKIQAVPINTVWARIHKARKKLSTHLVRLRKARAGEGPFMKRLLEDASELEASEQKLASLFAVAQPYGADPFRKRRVLVKLGERNERAPRILRGALVAGVLAITATAAAVGGGLASGWWSEPTMEPPAPSAVHTPNPRPAEALAPAPAQAPEAAKPSEPAPAAPALDAPKSSPKLDERARSKNGEDPTEVLGAMKALRAEHDPAKAQGLLNDYMKRHPNGVLSEDALALSIEAAAARRDPRAKDYARRYLAKFPNGKYSALATRALKQ